MWPNHSPSSATRPRAARSARSRAPKTCRRPRTAGRRRLPRASPAPRRLRRRADAARVAERLLELGLPRRAAHARATPGRSARARQLVGELPLLRHRLGFSDVSGLREVGLLRSSITPISAAPRARSCRTWWRAGRHDLADQLERQRLVGDHRDLALTVPRRRRCPATWDDRARAAAARPADRSTRRCRRRSRPARPARTRGPW